MFEPWVGRLFPSKPSACLRGCAPFVGMIHDDPRGAPLGLAAWHNKPWAMRNKPSPSPSLAMAFWGPDHLRLCRAAGTGCEWSYDWSRGNQPGNWWWSSCSDIFWVSAEHYAETCQRLQSRFSFSKFDTNPGGHNTNLASTWDRQQPSGWYKWIQMVSLGLQCETSCCQVVWLEFRSAFFPPCSKHG